MRAIRSFLTIVVIIFASLPVQAQDAEPPEIEWRDWDDALFQLSEGTGRYVILDLNARWCHWCHFMEERTYSHPKIRELVDAAYFAVKVDQDANPDLAARYGDWGWPATIIFAPDGTEVAKLQGFQRPSRMAQILYTVVAAPDEVPALIDEPDVKPVRDGALSVEARKRMVDLLDATYDAEFGGWGRRLKFLQPHVVDFALRQSREGDETFRTRLIQSLDAAMVLNDPVAGGMYQYSHERDWSAPHYEKIMAFQANGISIYAKAYREFGTPAYLDTAESIAGYLMGPLRAPEGAFYTSQDADVDAEILGYDYYSLDADGRGAMGKAPGIDTNLYARENGWAASGLLDLYHVTGQDTYLTAAEEALTWIIANRGLTGGGYAHGDADEGGPYLSDNVAMGQAMLKLYMATGDVDWLKRAGASADFIAAQFTNADAGYATTAKPRVRAAAFAKPHVNIEENINLARFANMLARTYGDDRYRAMATHAMSYLVSDAITQRQRFMLGTVLADEDLSEEPAHVTIVGSADDPAADALHLAGLGLNIDYLRVDRWDPSTGPMFNADIEYPELDRAAAFACADGICSLPVFEPDALRAAVDRITK